MATPPYLSAPQSTANQGGWLRRIGSYFGGSGTPAYAGNGQPSPSGGGLFQTSPGYAAAPTGVPETPVEPSTCPCASAAEQEDVECPIDPEALAAGQIAIVIPRQGP